MERQEIIESLRKELFSAINRDDFQKVEKCIEEAESEHVKNEVLNSKEYGINPIRLATQERNLKILRFLIAKGGDINAATSTVYFSTPLHIAAADDELGIAQFLLDSGANINATNYEGFTPLYLASFYCRPDMVKLLLFNNADTSIKDMNGKTALNVAGGYRRNMCDSNTRQEIVSILEYVTFTVTIKTVLEVDDNSNTADMASKEVEQLTDELFAAMNIGNFQKVEKCIKEAENIGIKSRILSSERYSMKPIHFATNKCNLKILQLLLNEGTDINATSTEYLSTSLHIAAIHGELELGQFLLDSGANINAANYKGFTPLCLASFYCQSDMVELLLCNNADINIKDMNGKTALDIVGGYRKDICNRDSEMQRVISILSGTVSTDCKAILASTRVSLKAALESGSTTSNAVKPSSSINSIFSGITTAISGLFSSAPTLPPVQQSVAYSDERPIDFSQGNLHGIVMLGYVMFKHFTGKKYSGRLDDSLLTIQEIRERELNTMAKNVESIFSKCEKLYQCPESSLSNLTISKGMHQMSF